MTRKEPLEGVSMWDVVEGAHGHCRDVYRTYMGLGSFRKR